MTSPWPRGPGLSRRRFLAAAAVAAAVPVVGCSTTTPPPAAPPPTPAPAAVDLAAPAAQVLPRATVPVPFGAWAPEGFSHLDQAGFETAFQLSDDPVDPSRPLLSLRRALVDSSWTGEDVVARVSRPI